MYRSSTTILLACALLMLGPIACAQKSLRRLMIDLNRAYLRVHEDAKEEDFAALQSDAARLRELVGAMRPYNAAVEFQGSLDDLDAIARRIEAAGRESNALAARDAFAAMTVTCAECHRRYR